MTGIQRETRAHGLLVERPAAAGAPRPGPAARDGAGRPHGARRRGGGRGARDGARPAGDARRARHRRRSTGDGERLRQVLDNLLANVRAHTPPTPRAIVRLRREDGDARCSRSRTRAGPRAEQTAHVFERFYRGDPSRSRDHGGAGSAWPSWPRSSRPTAVRCRSRACPARERRSASGCHGRASRDRRSGRRSERPRGSAEERLGQRVVRARHRAQLLTASSSGAARPRCRGATSSGRSAARAPGRPPAARSGSRARGRRRSACRRAGGGRASSRASRRPVQLLELAPRALRRPPRGAHGRRRRRSSGVADLAPPPASSVSSARPR